jgi:hypothetical protein
MQIASRTLRQNGQPCSIITMHVLHTGLGALAASRQVLLAGAFCLPCAVRNANTREVTSNSYSSSGLSGRGKLPTVADDSSTFLPAANDRVPLA